MGFRLRSRFAVLGIAAVLLAGGPSGALADRMKTAILDYRNGHYQEAIPFFERRAREGDAEAQFWYGTMYYQGRGLPQNFREAMGWYRKAAEQGYADAENNLGLMYRNGEGCVASPVVAYAWMSLAAAQNNDIARQNLEDLREGLSAQKVLEGQQLAEELSRRIATVRTPPAPPPPAQAAPAALGPPRPLTPAPAPKPAPAAAPAEGFAVQIGLFHNRENVDRLRERLTRERIPVRIDTVSIMGNPYQRVRSEVFARADQAQSLAKRVDAMLGIQSTVIPLRP